MGSQDSSATGAASDAATGPVAATPARRPGSLTVRGVVLPVGGVTAKVTAAIEAGMKRVIIPFTNLGDVTLPKHLHEQIVIIPVKTIAEVLSNALYLEDSTLLEKFKGFPELLKAEDKADKTKLPDVVFRKKPGPSLPPSY